MARELDSEMLRRLQEQYREMSDGELLGLAARPDDLTEFALEVLRGEMTRRRLPYGVDGTAGGGASARVGESREVKQVRTGSVSLMTFNDAISAGEACRYLEEDGLEIDVRDLSAGATGGLFYGGSPVALQVIVRGVDEDRARRLLRERMGLFPVFEAQGEDAPEDGAVMTLGLFGRREDAEEVGRILVEAGVWHRVAMNPDGDAETEDAYCVEVREVDQAGAVEVVEKAMELPEE